MTIFFVADAHFGHSEIIVYCARPFETRKEMDKTLIKNWNACVGPDDTIYVLGDFTMKRSDVGFVEAKLKQLNGHKILVLGNHDHIDALTLVSLGFESVHTYFCIETEIGPLHMTHDPAVCQILDGAYWLCGHVHRLFRLSESGKILNVGVDVNNFAPISLEEVLEEFKCGKK